MNYWLMKSEPDVFGIDHLARAPGRKSGWDGVRNYQARNMLRDDFAVGDRAFFHSFELRDARNLRDDRRSSARATRTRASSTARASTTTRAATPRTRAGTRSRCAC